MSLRLQPVRVAATHNDTEGQLVFADDGLIAVLVHLSEDHGAEAGMWFLEAWFGGTYESKQPTFPSLDAAQEWIVGWLAKA